MFETSRNKNGKMKSNKVFNHILENLIRNYPILLYL